MKPNRMGFPRSMQPTCCQSCHNPLEAAKHFRFSNLGAVFNGSIPGLFAPEREGDVAINVCDLAQVHCRRGIVDASDNFLSCLNYHNETFQHSCILRCSSYALFLLSRCRPQLFHFSFIFSPYQPSSCCYSRYHCKSSIWPFRLHLAPWLSHSCSLGKGHLT